MKPINEFFSKQDRKIMLSWLWVFVMFNYAYADILTLMDSSVLKELVTGSASGLQISQEFLFAGAILMEIPIAMIVLSRILEYKANRIANIIAGIIKTIAVAASMFVGTPASYYLFFGIIEIATTSFIVWYAWTWPKQES